MAEEKKSVSLSDIMEEKEPETHQEEKKPITKNTIITPDMIGDSESQKANLKDIAPGLFVPKKSIEEKNADKLMGEVDSYLKQKADDLVKNVIDPFKEACIEKAMEAEEMEAAGIISDKNNVQEFAAALEAEKKKEAAQTEIPENIGDSVSDDLDELLNIADKATHDLEKDMKKSDSSKDISEIQKEFSDDEDDIDPDDLIPTEEEMEERNMKEVKLEERPATDEEIEIKTPPVQKEVHEEENAAPKKKETIIPNPMEDMSNAPSKINPQDAIAKVSTSMPEKTNIDIDNTLKPSTDKTLPQIDDDDFKEFLEDEENEVVNDEERKAVYNSFREQVIQKLKITPASEKRLTKFKISSKPISVNKVLKTAYNTINTATWVLPNSGRLITFSALSGEEIENLNPEDSNFLASRITFNTLYNHLIDANKPATMEEWLKTINWFDINDLYFAIYLATFKNSNFITYQCDNPACKNMYLEEKPYKDMITYVDDNAEKLYQDIIKKGIDMTPDTIEEDVIQINDKYAIGFRAPSIYDIVFGTSALEQKFRDKYATVIGSIAYMGNIYFIHHSSHVDEPVLMPVDCKPVENDSAKTMRNRIIAYYNILKSLNSDEYSIVSSTIINISNKSKVNAHFHYPESTCPKCKKVIKPSDEDISPLYLVFIRHRLARYASIMTE